MTKPIIFNSEMVKGILAGRKTMTRRVVKYKIQLERDSDITHPSAFSVYGKNGGQYYNEEEQSPMTLDDGFCPYGEVGGQLWVKEAWRPVERLDGVDGMLYHADESFKPIENTIQTANKWVEAYDNGKFSAKWKSSQLMPRWASRITLQITSIRVERLRDITEADALAEGVMPGIGDCGYEYDAAADKFDQIFSCHCCATARDKFRNQWPGSGKDSWAANPWVWCISFTEVK